jgi:hypothetical protein
MRALALVVALLTVQAFAAHISRLGLSTVALAQESTPLSDGNSFLRTCGDAGIGAAARATCIGYVLGMLDFYQRGPAISPPSCIPKDATYGQGYDILLRYLRSTPETRHKATAELLVDAMTAAHPCAR